jgi:2,3-bisphosphoglycerate-independent phosphoglycerate mutase
MFFFKKKKGTNHIKPVVLVILDGFGVASPSAGNAISLARTPNYDKYKALYPYGELVTSGESVGLPANEVGSSEVGHLIIGAGRVILQPLKRINQAIEDKSFFKNKAFIKAVKHVKKYDSKLHLMGLVGSGSVHSSNEHLFALLEFCKKRNLKKVYLHLFTDGRDSPPQEALEIISKIETFLKTNKIGQIASISGRYYAMDRDKRWDRTKKAYRALVLGEGEKATSAKEAIEKAYNQALTDEFIKPTVIVKKEKPVATIDDYDAVIFFNFRIDRAIQLTTAFVLPNFEKLKSFGFSHLPHQDKAEGEARFYSTFNRGKILKNLNFTTMTQYHKKLPVTSVAFGPKIVKLPLSQVLAKKGLKQLHMAESEKERTVTFYFDGFRQKAFKGEDFIIIPSPNVASYDQRPEMSADKILKEFKKQINKNKYHFMVVNFANPDMVAHSGDIKATVAAIEVIDKVLGELVRKVMSCKGTVLVTADHGNAEELLSLSGTISTDHSNNLVPFLIIDKALKRRKRLARGTLADIAPTILAIMGIDKPSVMTGRNLLKLEK